MFRLIAFIGFIVIICGIVLHHLLFPCGYKKRFAPTTLVRKKVHLFTLLFPEQSRTWPSRLRKLAFVVAVFSFMVLLLTGFGPVLLGGRLHGWLLMIHATFAPVLIACAAFIAITGAVQYTFSSKDKKFIPSPVCQRPTFSEGCWLTDSGIGAKTCFWTLLVLSLPVTLSIVVSMLPLIGTEGQAFLFQVHRWSALVFGWIAIIELYILIRMEIRKEFE